MMKESSVESILTGWQVVLVSFLRVFVYDLFLLLARLQCCVNEADMESVGVSVVW